ncbi:MAG: excinuclease ABC subunit UvrA [Ardenticatenales bacterium]
MGDQRHNAIVVRGAREHNLKNIDVTIPRDKLVVMTGLSGSGKSSLAFDTIYAEGQRRYVESLSAYARQFLGQMEKPDVDGIEGLSPAISIDQKGVSHNPRSTVGTVTEIYDYLRLLFARIGVPHCPSCGRAIQRQSPEQIADAISELPDGTRLLVLAPLVRDRKGSHERIFDDIRQAGFVRVRVDGVLGHVDDEHVLDRYKLHTIEAVVDRLVVRGGEDGLDRTRLIDSVETALRSGDGVLSVATIDEAGGVVDERLFSEHFACPNCGISLPKIEPRSFSFNSPHGACPTCQGLGAQMQVDPELVVPNPDLTIDEGALAPISRSRTEAGYFQQILAALATDLKFSLGTPWRRLSEAARHAVLYGTDGRRIEVIYKTRSGGKRRYETAFEGIINNLQRRHVATESEFMRTEIERFMGAQPCPECHGARLRPEVLAVTVGDSRINDVGAAPIRELLGWVDGLRGAAGSGNAVGAPGGGGNGAGPMRNGAAASNGHSAKGAKGAKANAMAVTRGAPEWPESDLPVAPAEHTARLAPARELGTTDRMIAVDVLKEIASRARFLIDVGLDYLTLDRRAATLSGGEAQRIRLATQIGSQLMGVLYILDEPSIGLHSRDNARLIRTLLNLRDVGNTVIVVEHDEEMMRSADWIVDLGPGAGEHGGQVVAAGTVADIEASEASLTGAFLSGRRQIPVPERRRPGKGALLKVIGATENNLRGIDVGIPLGTLTVVTGVSGSGKSTLVLDILYQRLAQLVSNARGKAGAHKRITGWESIDKVIDIDQSPIGRTPRSNPATYTAAFTQIRDLFSGLPEAKLRGYAPGRFSFNVKGGRCEACQGDGILKIEMQFLPDVYVPCEVCHGARYNRETLQITFKNKSIADVLDMTVSEALLFFDAIPGLKRKLATLNSVGLGYIRLGQPAPTLSGGEAQRVKLAKELSRVATGDTLYILDEPTTGLHFADTERLLDVLQRLVDAGNTVLVIEHNLDIIKAADWIIDLGPDGGERGGTVLAAGTPEAVAAVADSYTGAYLKQVLAGKWTPEPVRVLDDPSRT